MRVLISIVIALLFESTTAFSPSSRRAFFDGAVSSVLVGTAAVAPAWAVDDLAMPTPEEQKAMDEAAMQERLRRKAELQKQAAAPKGFTDGFKAERAKQSELSTMSKEARRNALCEELGRGC